MIMKRYDEDMGCKEILSFIKCIVGDDIDDRTLTVKVKNRIEEDTAGYGKVLDEYYVMRTAGQMALEMTKGGIDMRKDYKEYTKQELLERIKELKTILAAVVEPLTEQEKMLCILGIDKDMEHSKFTGDRTPYEKFINVVLEKTQADKAIPAEDVALMAEVLCQYVCDENPDSIDRLMKTEYLHEICEKAMEEIDALENARDEGLDAKEYYHMDIVEIPAYIVPWLN